MDDDDFFSAFEELQESTAKAEAIHKALADDDDALEGVGGVSASNSATSINSTDSAASLGGDESDIEIIEPTNLRNNANNHRPFTSSSTISNLSSLNPVTNPDGTTTIRLPPGTDANALLAGLRPSSALSTFSPKISVIPNSISAAHAQAAMMRGGKQVVSLNSSGLPTTSRPIFVGMNGGVPRPMTLPNGSSSMHNQQMASLNQPGLVGNRMSTPMMAIGARGNLMQMQNNARMSTYGECYMKLVSFLAWLNLEDGIVYRGHTCT